MLLQHLQIYAIMRVVFPLDFHLYVNYVTNHDLGVHTGLPLRAPLMLNSPSYMHSPNPKQKCATLGE